MPMLKKILSGRHEIAGNLNPIFICLRIRNMQILCNLKKEKIKEKNVSLIII